MNLRQIRIALWIAVAAALVGVAVMRLLPRDAEVAEAAFRPAFSLPDSAGQVRSMEDFRGRYLLVFFGFTNCPDVCPTTMVEVADVMDDLGADAGRVQPLFISIDPERDMALGLDDYLAAFHPSILGLAGDAEATRAAAASFHIFYEREEDAAAPDGYTMSHSPALYLVGPDGGWLRQFTYGTPAGEILTDLQERL